MEPDRSGTARDLSQDQKSEERQWPDDETLGRDGATACHEVPGSERPSKDARPHPNVAHLWPKESDGTYMRVPGIKENAVCQFDALTGFLRCEFKKGVPPKTDCRRVGCPYSALMRMRSVNRARQYALGKKQREGQS